jgi:hypothetical protein
MASLAAAAVDLCAGKFKEQSHAEFTVFHAGQLAIPLVGREWLFTRIGEWFQDSKACNTLLITGDPGTVRALCLALLLRSCSFICLPVVAGIGKSTLCVHLFGSFDHKDARLLRFKPAVGGLFLDEPSRVSVAGFLCHEAARCCSATIFVVSA